MDISVIIPFYDGNIHLKKIKRMLDENVKILDGKAKVELIIVNDSPWVEIDASRLVSDEYEVKVVNNEKNLGIHGSRVKGLKLSKGKYVLMLDQDDLISSNCLYSHYTKIGNADISVSNGYKFDGKSNEKIYGSHKKHLKVNDLFYYIYLENRIMSPGQCLIKKKSIPEQWYTCVMKKNGADDMLLWILMLEKNCVFFVNEDNLYTHVYTGINVSGDELKMSESTYEMLDIMQKEGITSSWMRWLLKRKIENDVCIAKIGKDKFIDYKIIEFLRKIRMRTR